MKHANGNNTQRQSQAKPVKIRQLKALTIEQRNAIDLLIVGKSDQDTADAIGVSRQTVWGWRTSHLLFQSELEQARSAFWRLTAERLRGMMSKALDNIAAAIDAGGVKAAFELLKAVNLYGAKEINQIRDWRMSSLIRQQAEAQAKAEGLLENPTDAMLINMTINPAYLQRREEIEAQLWAEYCEE